ncbi:hypothetical protein JCM3774_003956 [Rhodotorula dairenensis]
MRVWTVWGSGVKVKLAAAVAADRSPHLLDSVKLVSTALLNQFTDWLATAATLEQRKTVAAAVELLKKEPVEGFFCVEDFDVSHRDEVRLATAYHVHFTKAATTPSRSGRKKLLDKAEQRWEDGVTPSSMESPIRIKDMQVPRIHSGRYLLCQIISPPRPRHPRTDVVQAFRGKSIVIRIDSPTDYALLLSSAALLDGAKWSTASPRRKRLPTIEALRAKGNKYMTGSIFSCAVKAYSDALALEPTPEERLVLALNHTQAQLRSSNYASCHRDASIVLVYLAQGVNGPPAAETKVRFRRAAALHKMRRHKRALEEYERVLKLDENQEQAKTAKVALERALEQSRTGVYDWDALDLHNDAPDDTLTLGDYFGPIKVVDMPHRLGRRGVVATRLTLFGGGAVETVFCVGIEDTDLRQCGFDLRTVTMCELAKANLVTLLAQRIVDNPKTASLVYSLTGGTAFPPSGALSFGADQDEEPSLFALPVDVDIERLEAIVHLNAINLEDPGANHVNDRDTMSAGLFLGASAFNHSKLIEEEYATMRTTISQAATFSRRAAVRSRMRQMLDSLEATYEGSTRAIQVSLLQQYSVYAYASELHSAADYKNLVDYELKSLRCLGGEFVFGPNKVDVVALPLRSDGCEKLHRRFLYLARDCLLCGIPQVEREVHKWISAAWQVTNMTMGWSWNHFKECEGATLDQCNLRRFVTSWRPAP